MKYSNNLPSNPNFPQLEEKVLKFWNEQKIFSQSLDYTKEKEKFVFYDGPPFANGLPHYGHLLTSCAKDTVGRFQTMCGKHVERRFGWDCHGLPAEMAAEKELNVSGRKAIEEFGIDKFNDYCKNNVMKYSEEWEKYINRVGRWVDMKNAYKTMDLPFMESILWAFKNLYDNNLIYEEMRVMPYSWACQTPLSNFETRLDDSYRIKESKSLIVKFQLKTIPDALKKYNISNINILIWTTTPWTLPSNLALAVNENLQYEYFVNGEKQEIYISANLKNYFKDLGIEKSKEELKNLALNTISGKELINIEYKPLFDYFIKNASENCFKIYSGDFVTATDGTGVVHMAPGFGEDDFELCKKEKIGIYYNSNSTRDFTLSNRPSSNQDLAHDLICSSGEIFGASEDLTNTYCVNSSGESIANVGLGSLDNENLAHDRKDTSYINFPGGDSCVKDSFNSEEKNRIKDIGKSVQFLNTNVLRLATDNEYINKQINNYYNSNTDNLKNQGFYLMPAVPVDDSGKFTNEIYDFEGLQVFDANDEIIKKLKIQGSWVKTDQYLHSYPHCWRTDTPIIFRAMPSFYVRVADHRHRLCELNQKINWIPENVKDGLFGHWLKDARDWSISRKRYFGTPIPVWKSTDSKHPCVKVFGSVKELKEFFGPYYLQTHKKELKITDLHRPFIDELIAPNPNDPTGKSMLKRVTDVFDCWFESGSMSFAEYHYPFNSETHDGPNYEENSTNFDSKKYPPKRLPADFIVEYAAQTRGWFYTLMVLSTLIFDDIPFKNCICHGLILDENGKKLSKKLQNYVDPMDAMNLYGADALRYVMMSSPVMHGGELLIDKDGKMLQEALRLIHKPIWSALNFFILYAKEDQPKITLLTLNDIEKWDVEGNEHDFTILLRVFELNLLIFDHMNSYRIADCYREIRNFIDDLNNLYIRRNRDRFWGAEMNEAKSQAYNVLFSTLYYLAIGIAPLMPFLSEIIFQTITNDEAKSVHLEKVLINDEIKNLYQKLKTENKDLIFNISILKDIFYSGRSLRDDKLKIRMRQPLSECTLITNLPLINEYSNFLKSEIKDELNVKNVSIIDDQNLSEENKKRFTRNLKLNIKILGKKYGQKLKEMQIALAKKDYKISENNVLEIANEKLTKDEFYWEVKINEEFERNTNIAINSENDYAIVILNEKLTEDLILEGIMRDIVRSIQDARKKTLNIVDRIELHIFSKHGEVIKACEKYSDYIKKETLIKENLLFVTKFENDNELTKIEDDVVKKDMMIFGYEIENGQTKENLFLKLSYKKV